MNNERILNLIVNVQNNSDPTFTKLRNQFLQLRQNVGSMLSSSNELLKLWFKTWDDLAGKVQTVGLAIMALRHAIPLIQKLVGEGKHWIKRIIEIGVMWHAFRRQFDNIINHILNKIKAFLFVLEIEVPDAFKGVVRAVRSSVNFVQHNDPFKLLGNSAQAAAKKISALGAQMKQGGGMGNWLGGTAVQGVGAGVGALGTVLGNPVLGGTLLFGSQLLGGITDTIKTLIGLSVQWVEITLNGIKTILSAVAKLGLAMTAVFIKANEEAVQLHKQYQMLEKQFETVFRNFTEKGGSTFMKDVKASAKQQIDDLIKFLRQYAQVRDQDIFEGVIETKMLGFESSIETAFRKVEMTNPIKVKGKSPMEKFLETVVNASAAFNVNEREMITSVNNAMLGNFEMLKNRTGINRSMATGAGGGDPISGMFELLIKRSEGAASRVQDTWDNVMTSIQQKWVDEFRDFTKPAFENLNRFVVMVRDLMTNIFNSKEWETTKANLFKIFDMFTDFGRSSFFRQVEAMIKDLLNAFNSQEVQGFFKELSESIKILAPAAMSLAKLIAGELTTAIKGLPNWIRMLVDHTLLFVGYLQAEWPRVVDMIKSTIDNILRFWMKLGVMAMSVFETIGNILQAIYMKGDLKRYGFGFDMDERAKANGFRDTASFDRAMMKEFAASRPFTKDNRDETIKELRQKGEINRKMIVPGLGGPQNSAIQEIQFKLPEEIVKRYGGAANIPDNVMNDLMDQEFKKRQAKFREMMGGPNVMMSQVLGGPRRIKEWMEKVSNDPKPVLESIFGFENKGASMDLAKKFRDEQMAKIFGNKEMKPETPTESAGRRPGVEKEVFLEMIKFLQETGQHTKALSFLFDDFSKAASQTSGIVSVLGEDLGQLQLAMDNLTKSFQGDQFMQVNNNLSAFIEALRVLRQDTFLLINAWEQLNEAVRVTQRSALNFAQDMNAPFSPAVAALYLDTLKTINDEIATARLKAKIAYDTNDFQTYNEQSDLIINKTREQVTIFKQMKDAQTGFMKEGLDAVNSLIEAQRHYNEVYFSDKGPFAGYEAERRNLRDQLDLLKMIRETQIADLNNIIEKQKILGGQTNEYIRQLAVIKDTDAQMMKIEKTLKNIAAPSFLEQVIGAPQRVLALLPTAQQLYNKAKYTINPNRSTMPGTGFSTFVLPQMFGGDPMAALMSGSRDAGRYLGSKFLPSHIFGNNSGATNTRELAAQIARDRSRAAEDMAGLAKRANVVTVNASPTVNIQVADVERQWDSVIAPRVKKMVMETIKQQEYAKSRNFQR